MGSLRWAVTLDRAVPETESSAGSTALRSNRIAVSAIEGDDAGASRNGDRAQRDAAHALQRLSGR